MTHDSRRTLTHDARRTAITLAVLLASTVLACTRQPPSRPAPETSSVAQLGVRSLTDASSIDFLIAEGTQRSRVPEDLEYLTDVIGPRLTGSAAMRRANEWAAAKLREYGADSVALEPWRFGVSWQRGPISMRMLQPHERWLSAVSVGWSPGTNGPSAGEVIFFDATSRAEFDRRLAGRMRGSWIILERPRPRTNPDAPDARDSARVDSLRRAIEAEWDRITPQQREFYSTLRTLFLQNGIAGVLEDAGKDFGLFTMYGSPEMVSPFPRVIVPNATYAELYRLLMRNERVRVEINASNIFGRDTLVQWNTVGEIRGRERPDEVVLLGAHLDSWDLGTGATDNATGSIAVLEAARLLGALKARGVRPRRSIRFALFSGEEQGLYGSRAYVLSHADEMPRFQAVLVLDNGTGRIRGLPLQGWNELHDLWRTMLRPLAILGTINVRAGTKGGTDHLPFLEAAVPSFNYDQYSTGYDHTHHSQVDVLAHAVPADVAQAATIMAVNALQLANLDRLLPRKK
jgi:hypothetical protein